MFNRCRDLFLNIKRAYFFGGVARFLYTKKTTISGSLFPASGGDPTTNITLFLLSLQQEPQETPLLLVPPLVPLQSLLLRPLPQQEPQG